MGNANRRKGHQKERDVVNKFKELGHNFAKTSRQASRLLDDCQVDIAFVPYNVQVKKGYKKGLNYASIFRQMKELLKENFPPDDKQHGYPSIIIHDKDRAQEEKLVIMKENEFWELLKKIEDGK